MCGKKIKNYYKNIGGLYMSNDGKIFAFIFDSGAVNSHSYGQVVFEKMICGKELIKNPHKIIVSLGDMLVPGKWFDIDIEPYVYKDEYCTIDFNKLRNYKFKDWPWVWITEDIIPDIAKLIDSRLKKSCNAYIGMFKINQTSTNERKQFWKGMIRSFAIHGDKIITFFDEENNGYFLDDQILNKYGYKKEIYKVNSFYSLENEIFLQSRLVTTGKDLELIKDKKDKEIDRDLSDLNFSIRDELQIAGALIWKSICSLDRINFSKIGQMTKLVEHSFMTLYFASQGIERIQKSLIELICKNKHIKESEKNKVYELLMSHSHNGLNDWIEREYSIKLKPNEKKFLNILSEFYNTKRYSRYSDETYLESTTPEIDLLERLVDGKVEKSEDIKKAFGKCLGELSTDYYKALYNICAELNIYLYEMEYDSAASRVFLNNNKNLFDYYKIIQKYKKEVLYWVLKSGDKYPKYEYCEEVDPLEFDPQMIDEYLEEIVQFSEDKYSYFDEADYCYDELYTSNKEEWKKRLELIDRLFNSSYE